MVLCALHLARCLPPGLHSLAGRIPQRLACTTVVRLDTATPDSSRTSTLKLVTWTTLSVMHVNVQCVAVQPPASGPLGMLRQPGMEATLPQRTMALTAEESMSCPAIHCSNTNGTVTVRVSPPDTASVLSEGGSPADVTGEPGRSGVDASVTALPDVRSVGGCRRRSDLRVRPSQATVITSSVTAEQRGCHELVSQHFASDRIVSRPLTTGSLTTTKLG